MKQYIALLRGINVGGYRKIRMDDLRKMFREMGHDRVSTYIQSGNVVFSASVSEPSKLDSAIRRQIKKTFGHEVPVMIRTPEEIAAGLARFPFKEKEGWKGYISFLGGEPIGTTIKELESLSSEIEKFKAGEQILYSLVNKQTDKKTRFSNSFVEKNLGLSSTTRNLRTVRKILELAGS